MNYQIDYEIERYEVRLLLDNAGLDRDEEDVEFSETFYTEEEAVEFAVKYQKEHPGWHAGIRRIERAIVLVW